MGVSDQAAAAERSDADETPGRTTVAASSLPGSGASEVSSCSGRSRDLEHAVDWGRLQLGRRMRSSAGHAYCVEDVYLLSTFLHLAQVQEIDGAGFRLLFRALKLLRLCDYAGEDICSMLAHASAYFEDVHGICRKEMDCREVAHVLTSLLFIAHCFVHDETCPLHVWHEYLFKRYCPLRTLNAAIMRLMTLRQHRLRLPDADLTIRYERLTSALARRRPP